MLEISNYSKRELADLIKINADNTSPEIKETAAALKERYYGKAVYMRGLIEFTNYCKNDCYYCGIRNSAKIVRYRLSKEQILSCCESGYNLGFRTFVLQGGEDPFYTDDKMCGIISSIKEIHPNCALTLSVGEKSYAAYKRYYAAGADRYLLRHETADSAHYKKLHPKSMKIEKRKECLYSLKDIGYQVGAGFMVGSPYQTCENLAEDLLFLKELQPHMVGIGPFIPSAHTPFSNKSGGNVNLTLLMIVLTRIILPKALLPATTALGTADESGREKALAVGGNVVMPNLSPASVRSDYALYDNKICTGDEAAECCMCIKQRITRSGYEVSMDRGDFIDLQGNV